MMASSARRGWLVVAVAVAAVMATATTAGAHGVSPSIGVPAAPPPEDSAFGIALSGDVSGLRFGDAYLYVKVRRAGGTPCAPVQRSDPGESVVRFEDVSDVFTYTASYTAPEPGEYLICAWLEEAISGDSGPPASAGMTVRAAVLELAAAAPRTVAQRTPFAVDVAYRAEVPRYLTVLLARTASCSVGSSALRGISSSTLTIVDAAQVSGAGRLRSTARIDDTGTYRLCGFFDEQHPDLARSVAGRVVALGTVVVGRPAAAFRSCGRVGGPRNVRSVRARSVGCTAARSIARRWGRARRAPRRVGAYRCFARSGAVTCTAGRAQVRFRFGRV